MHYVRHRPEQTKLYRLVQQHAQSFFAQTEEATGACLPQFVKDEFDAYLECGILAHGFLRLRGLTGDRQRFSLMPTAGWCLFGAALHLGRRTAALEANGSAPVGSMWARHPLLRSRIGAIWANRASGNGWRWHTSAAPM